MKLLVAAALPLVYWDASSDRTKMLVEAGIHSIGLPPARAATWKATPSIHTEIVDPSKLTRLTAPGVRYQITASTPTGEPWIVTNGWRFLRNASARYYYDVPANSAMLAAAESHMWSGQSVIRTEDAGLPGLERMLEFLAALGPAPTVPLVNIGFTDRGSPVDGEIMNLLVRKNLLFRPVAKPDPALDLNVRIGNPEYPAEQARNPYFMAQRIRGELGDDKRLVRVFGSQVTLARLAGDQQRARLYLLNYDPKRHASGIRLRVRGPFRTASAKIFGASSQLRDVTADGAGIEFTVEDLPSYAVVELAR